MSLCCWWKILKIFKLGNKISIKRLSFHMHSPVAKCPPSTSFPSKQRYMLDYIGKLLPVTSKALLLCIGTVWSISYKLALTCCVYLEGGNHEVLSRNISFILLIIHCGKTLVLYWPVLLHLYGAFIWITMVSRTVIVLAAELWRASSRHRYDTTAQWEFNNRFIDIFIFKFLIVLQIKLESRSMCVSTIMIKTMNAFHISWEVSFTNGLWPVVFINHRLPYVENACRSQ